MVDVGFIMSEVKSPGRGPGDDTIKRVARGWDRLSPAAQSEK